MAKNTLTITDNRTGKQYEIRIEEGEVIRASSLRDIKTSPDDFVIMSYDPAFTNTASCRSRITFRGPHRHQAPEVDKPCHGGDEVQRLVRGDAGFLRLTRDVHLDQDGLGRSGAGKLAREAEGIHRMDEGEAAGRLTDFVGLEVADEVPLDRDRALLAAG